jgi:hypothetical protein
MSTRLSRAIDDDIPKRFAALDRIAPAHGSDIGVHVRAGAASARELELNASDHADHQLHDLLIFQFLTAQRAPVRAENLVRLIW